MVFKSTISGFMKKRVFKHGLPFVIFIVGGSFGLREFTQVRYVENLIYIFGLNVYFFLKSYPSKFYVLMSLNKH